VTERRGRRRCEAAELACAEGLSRRSP
jgi:hypothetical protein